jgi:bifunctional enzyme CysN/CysC
VTLDEQIFIERGEIATYDTSIPLVSTAFRANIFWLGRRPLERGRKYAVRLATREVDCEIAAIHKIVDAAELGERQPSTGVGRNEVADLTIRTKSPLAFDLYTDLEATARFVLVDGHDIAGGGIITEMVHDEQEFLRDEARRRDFAWIKGEVGAEDRARHFGHRAAIVLFTGVAQTGKSFLARKLEALLVAEGRHAYLLDGENLRRGLDADLTKADPMEMVRRYGEVARLLIDTGLIVVSTASPFGLPPHQVVQVMRTLVHPAPVIAVHMSKAEEEPPVTTDLHFAGPRNFDSEARQIIEELKRRGVLAHTIGAKPTFQYSI